MTGVDASHKIKMNNFGERLTYGYRCVQCAIIKFILLSNSMNLYNRTDTNTFFVVVVMLTFSCTNIYRVARVRTKSIVSRQIFPSSLVERERATVYHIFYDDTSVYLWFDRFELFERNRHRSNFIWNLSLIFLRRTQYTPEGMSHSHFRQPTAVNLCRWTWAPRTCFLSPQKLKIKKMNILWRVYVSSKLKASMLNEYLMKLLASRTRTWYRLWYQSTGLKTFDIQIDLRYHLIRFHTFGQYLMTGRRLTIIDACSTVFEVHTSH